MKKETEELLKVARIGKIASKEYRDYCVKQLKEARFFGDIVKVSLKREPGWTIYKTNNFIRPNEKLVSLIREDARTCIICKKKVYNEYVIINNNKFLGRHLNCIRSSPIKLNAIEKHTNNKKSQVKVRPNDAHSYNDNEWRY